MQSLSNTRFYSIRAEANALGGFLEEPFRKVLPTVAPVSLPAVGGFATARSEAFTFEEIVSFSSAHTLATAQEHADGSVSILVTAVTEGLNILEVVEAERLVAQLSITVPSDRGPIRVSKAGTQFQGLRVDGRPVHPEWNAKLQHLALDEEGRAVGFTLEDAAEEGRKQAAAIIAGFKGTFEQKWVEKRFGWMTAERPRNGYLCSLVDGFEGAGSKSPGHFKVVPGFGRFFFGELLVGPDSAQLVSVRAELGCSVSGKITTNTAGGGGVGDT